MISKLSDESKISLQSNAKKAVMAWGAKRQALACVEELAELSALLCRFSNDKSRDNLTEDIAEEIVDCLIVLEQMTGLFFAGQIYFEEALQRKLDKLAGHLAKT